MPQNDLSDSLIQDVRDVATAVDLTTPSILVNIGSPPTPRQPVSSRFA